MRRITLRTMGRSPKELAAAKKGSTIDATAPEENIKLRLPGLTDRSEL
jgi:hypothetical protein